jgi:hypothetical protein
LDRYIKQVLVYSDQKQDYISVDSDEFLIIGGICKQSTTRLDSMLIYDTTNNTLRELGSWFTSPKCRFGAVIYQEMIYIDGGSDNKSIVSTL